MVGYAKTTATDRTLPPEAARREGYELFDRWIANHDREVAAKSIRDSEPSEEPQRRQEDLVMDVLAKHGIESTGLGEVSCGGCRERGWLSWPQYYAHVAEAVVKELGDLHE